MTEFLTVPEAAVYLKTTPAYIYKLTFERKLPCYKPNGRLFFDPAELEEFVRKGRRLTHDELSDRATVILNGEERRRI